jgi:signal transduction histidine kinase/ActR/RegA family two-component response regulator
MQVREGFDSLATSMVGRGQYWVAGGFCFLALVVTCALLPMATSPMPAMPGFIPVYQTALVLVYAITTFLLFTQYAQARSMQVLILAAGSFYTTAMVFLQLLNFPNILAPGLLMGQGSDTLVWLWTLWHIGPPLFALPYALMERRRKWVLGARQTIWVGALMVIGCGALSIAVGIVVTQYVQLLPKTARGDDYWLLTTSGIAPAVEALTILALAVVCWTTRLRTVLQLWLAVSLFLLVLDNVVTDFGAARGSVGWAAGRVEALLAGAVILAVYLTELDFLRRHAMVLAAERETARRTAQSTRDHLATALRATGMGGWELDLRDDTTHRTVCYDQIFGYAAHPPAWGMDTFVEHVVPEDRAAARAAFDAAIQGGELRLECRIRRASDGERRWIALLGKTQYDSAGVAVAMAGCVMDTSERRRAEDRLRDAERDASIGQLIGGVAHDFNNLLAVIFSSLEMIQSQMGPSLARNRDTVLRLADEGLNAAQRGAEVTRSLLTYSRRSPMRRDVVDVNRLIDRFGPLLRHAAGGGVDVAIDLDPTVGLVSIDPSQLEAALLNLVANARDAMTRRGQVRVATRHVRHHGEAAGQYDLDPGDYALISVSDDGAGMDAATARSAFEPYFTTKAVGEGTGLGLSQVYGFAKQMGGGARIVSGIGAGTTVELRLPRHAGAVAAERPRIVAPRAVAHGEVVLVVEDEPAVQDVVVQLLEWLGYNTLTADSAMAALERLRSDEPIDVMFSDVMMPGGMNGVELAAAARTIRVGLKVVLTSGYAASALGREAGLPPDVPLLSKPYRGDDLAETLQRVLRPDPDARRVGPPAWARRYAQGH